MIKITFPDGNVREYESGITGYEIAKGISPRLAAEVLAVSVKPEGDESIDAGETIDLTRPITGNCSIRLLKWEDEEGKRVFWHSSGGGSRSSLSRSEIRNRSCRRQRFLL